MKKNLIEELLDLKSLMHFSLRAEACPIQDPFRIRSRYLGWKTASLLIDKKGEVTQAVLDQLCEAFFDGFYPVGRHEGDAWIYEHLFLCLKELQENPHIAKALKKCSLPLCSKDAEKIVRDTLWPDQIDILTHAHVRRAVLTAWFTLLRQSVGSCFATAPAILIQREDPLLLIKDLDQILSSGELRRGSHAAPLYGGSGPGDLQKRIDSYRLELSPGLHAAFHSAKVPFPSSYSNNMHVKELIEESFLSFFGLTQEDLAKESVSLSMQMGVFWEKMGGNYSGISQSGKQIRAWERAVDVGTRAFLSMADCALLRAWEYTLASFSDVKVEFARWNLFVSLGLNRDATPRGIGAVLLEIVQRKLDEANDQLIRKGEEIQRLVQGVRGTERLLQGAITQAEAGRLKAELVTQVHVVNSLSEEIENDKEAAHFLSQVYSRLLNEAIEKMQISFQEVFDPAAGDGKEERFEDRSAGFRLLYKSGRSAAGSWEKIVDEQGFVRAIYQFFESLETQHAVDSPMQSRFTLIMTELLQYIQSEEFLQGALERARQNKRAKGALPWAYESGGTVQTLLQSYYEIPEKREELSQTIQSPAELDRFLQAAAQQLPLKRSLMISPTHACIFCPDRMDASASSDEEHRYLERLRVTPLQAAFAIERLGQTLPPKSRSLFIAGCGSSFGSDLLGFRKCLLAGWSHANLFHPQKVDGFLYEAFPILNSDEAFSCLERLYLQLGIEQPTPEISENFFLASDLIAFLQKKLMEEKGSFSSTDWNLELARALRKEGLCYPNPRLFADTNWSDWSFGIIRNIATRELELWRLSRTGLSGMPMREWDSVFMENGRWAILP